MSKVIKDIKDIKDIKENEDKKTNVNKYMELKIKKLASNPIFRRYNYGEYCYPINDDDYDKQSAIYCNIENKYCGLCFAQPNIESIKQFCLIPLIVLNKIYRYKFNRKNNNNHNMKFMDKKYKCITLPFDPYYKWKIDVYKLYAETDCGYQIKYSVNITRMEKCQKITDNFVPSI
jgi:hypothetical protein